MQGRRNKKEKRERRKTWKFKCSPYVINHAKQVAHPRHSHAVHQKRHRPMILVDSQRPSPNSQPRPGRQEGLENEERDVHLSNAQLVVGEVLGGGIGAVGHGVGYLCEEGA